MRGHRGGRGRGRPGGGRGGRGGHGRGGRGRGPRRHGGRGGQVDGNERERISVESGFLVLIDQFMLANPQFIERLVAVIDSEPQVKDQIIQDFGGVVVEVEPGTYRIERNPYAPSIVVHPEQDRPDLETLKDTATAGKGEVFVDTRCLAMVDRELLDDSSLLEKYQQLWFSGQEKACRDLIRDNGGAVRYGFQRYGDELVVFVDPEMDVVCLWPSKSAEETPAVAAI